MIIAISGKPGSGKSTTAKQVAKKLGYKHYSMGDLQREIASERGLTIKQLGDLESKDPTIDKQIDERQRQLGQTEDNFVIDGWLSAHFIPKAIKIFLDVDIEEGIRRIFAQKRSKEKYRDLDHAAKEIKERHEVNKKRWMEYYNFQYDDLSAYDLVIDTTDKKQEEVADKIVSFVTSP